MNNKSFLCNFIAEHPDDWEAILTKDYLIKVKRDGSYAIFVYTVYADFSDPIVQEARGIIIDTDTLEVVCWPFRKFGNHNESYADKIDWSTARVLEKVDGSIIKLWYDKRAESWQFSTNGTIRAEVAAIDAYPGIRFGDIIKTAENYKDIPFDSLDHDKTYIFELVSPETKIVVKYNGTSLYHIGTRHNVTGVETEEDIGIKKPVSYQLSSLSDCLSAASALNKDLSKGEVANEGFVVVDAQYRRVKIKSPDYILRHRMMNKESLPKRDCVELLLTDQQKITALTEINPALIPCFKFYDFALAELCHTADKLATIAKRLYEEYSGDRGAVAKIILKHKLSSIAMRTLSSDKSGSEVLLTLSADRIANLMPTYEPEDLYYLFNDEAE